MFIFYLVVVYTFFSIFFFLLLAYTLLYLTAISLCRYINLRTIKKEKSRDCCLSFCTFCFWPLCCLFFFDIHILITLSYSWSQETRLNANKGNKILGTTLKDEQHGHIHKRKWQAIFMKHPPCCFHKRLIGDRGKSQTCIKGKKMHCYLSSWWWLLNSCSDDFNLRVT